jgi:hypothetical protein
MNVFFLAKCPTKAAQMQCDKHVVKMILETAQLLSTAHHLCGEGGPYKVTHQNHPSAVWARESVANYRWLYAHLEALSDEYTERYAKVHKTWREHAQALSRCPEGIKGLKFTEPPQCMPDECKQGDTTVAYMVYYNHKADEWAAKGSPMKWYGSTAE